MPGDLDFLDPGDDSPQPRGEQDRHGGSRERAYDRREVDERMSIDAWSPANVLQTPPDSGDYRYRWVTEYVNGVGTPSNVQRRLREKYERVKITDLPEGFIVDEDRGDGFARTGGLVLMRRAMRFEEQRRAHYQQLTTKAARSADQLQGVEGMPLPSVAEDRGSRSLTGSAASGFLRESSGR